MGYSIVLNYLRQIELDKISLKQLTLKTVILLALMSGQRIQTIPVLKTTIINILYSELEFTLIVFKKQTKPGSIYFIKHLLQ